MVSPSLYIQKTNSKGRGVFTRDDIAAGTIIEDSPVIVMSAEERTHLDKTLLHDYIFEWGEDAKQCCMALGYLAMYNHSANSNCEYFMDYDAHSMYIKTMRDIKAGEELTTNYNGDWNNPEKVWFEETGKD